MHRARERLPTALTNEKLIELLRQAKSTEGTGLDIAGLREEIVRQNVGLVKSVAAKFLSSGEPLDDLIQAGYIGLLNAVANFDLARNTRFSTYATHLIQGEIRHHIRDKHSTIRIPQWFQTMNRRVKEVEEAFFQREGRPPTLSELASHLGLSEEQLTVLLRGRKTMTYISIDKQRRSSDPNPAPPTVEHLLVESDDLPFDVRMRLLVAIERLTEIQQHVIEGLFYEGKSQSQVGKELGISQRQVSRLKDRILGEVRGSLERGSDN